jgi:basic membrane protein A
MKKTRRLLLLLIVTMTLCGLQASVFNQTGGSEDPASQSKDLIKKFGLITGVLGDRGYNDMHYNGMIEAKKKYGIEFEYFDTLNIEETAVKIETLITRGASTIFVGQGYNNNVVVDQLAEGHSEIRFILIDGLALTPRKNVAAIVFEANEGAFLVGALAAMVSVTKRIALLGGEDIPEINNFRIGFEEGARYILPTIAVIVDFISHYDDEILPFFNPERAYAISLDLYRNQGVDLIFPPAGASVLGTFRAANEMKKFAVGVDSDQGYFYPGYILTSMMKNINVAIVLMIEKIVAGRFEAKTHYLGLAENGVGLAPMMESPSILTETILNKIRAIKDLIVNKKLVVTSIYHE